MTAFASPRASAHVRGFFRTPLDWLVLAVPVAFAIRFVPAWNNASLLFVVAGAGIIPLAGWLGRATEQIAAHTGAGIGGFLNATFGNAAELIIALMALSKGLTTVVKASLTGSIIGNLLLVLGASAFAGGLRFSHQRFNKTAARVSATAMSMGAAALIIPTVFHVTANARPGGWSAAAEQKLSRNCGRPFPHLRRDVALFAEDAQGALRRPAGGGKARAHFLARTRGDVPRRGDGPHRAPERISCRVD
jgi:Ca2+/H+ antiporter